MSITKTITKISTPLPIPIPRTKKSGNSVPAGGPVVVVSVAVSVVVVVLSDRTDTITTSEASFPARSVIVIVMKWVHTVMLSSVIETVSPVEFQVPDAITIDSITTS